MTLADPAYALDRVESVRLLSLLTGEYSQNRTQTNYDLARVCSAYTREGGRYMMVITSRSDIYQSLVWEVEISKKS